jgi:hypothetical protein
MSVHTKGTEIFQISNLMIHLKLLDKKEQANSKKKKTKTKTDGET